MSSYVYWECSSHQDKLACLDIFANALHTWKWAEMMNCVAVNLFQMPSRMPGLPTASPVTTRLVFCYAQSLLPDRISLKEFSLMGDFTPEKARLGTVFTLQFLWAAALLRKPLTLRAHVSGCILTLRQCARAYLRLTISSILNAPAMCNEPT